MMTSTEWVKRMETLADYPRSTYRNQYPWNCLYWDGNRWYGDCVNIQKSLFNGRDVYDPQPNTWQKDLSQTGDVTEWGLMEQCTDIRGDFSLLKEGEPRLLYKQGHIGAYLGKEKTIDGRIYNVVECTPAFGDGIVYSYVGPRGERCNYKGAAIANYWTHHAMPTKWVEYKKEPEPKPTKTYSDVATNRGSYKAIKWATQQGIVQGYKDGTYRPTEPCTREQIAVILWRQAGKPEI